MNRRLLNFSGVTIAWLSANPMTVVQSARTSFSSCVDTYCECPCTKKSCTTELVNDKGVEKTLH